MSRRLSPSGSRTALAWVGLGLILSWCGLSMATGAVELLNSSLAVHAMSGDPASWHPWHSPFGLTTILTLTVLSLTSLNLLGPGLVVGVVALLTAAPRRVAATGLLVVLVVGGVVADFWLQSRGSDSFTGDIVHDGRLRDLLLTLLPLAVGLSAAYLLVWPHHRRRESSVQRAT